MQKFENRIIFQAGFPNEELHENHGKWWVGTNKWDATLNGLGSEGWELVSVSMTLTSVMVGMKRSID
jgi:hypothetical protein